MPSASTSLNSDQAFTSSIRPSYQIGSPSNEAAQYAGLLYTPTVPASTCVEARPHIAHNLTLSMLPQVPNYIAFAPFTECWLNYLYKAISDGARAAILYQPTNTSNMGLPANAYVSSLLPVYILSYDAGAPVAQAMNQYSGNLTSVPNGDQLVTMFDSASYARLWLVVTRTVSNRTLPNLWIFLLIIVGVLCVLVGIISLTLNMRQYFARRDLRRRIAAGEVDLEALGIKRLTVPRKHIDGLPQKTWRSADNAAGATGFAQSSCAICLDDYEVDVTVLRELPCHHTFHPACIDPFLEKRSSLCPLCKRSVLPKGFIPSDTQLTAATIMRERQRRRRAAREGRETGRVHTAPESDEIELQPVHSGEASVIEGSAARPDLQGRLSFVQMTNLAPDNDEEAAQIRRLPRWRRALRTLFPSH